MAYVDYNYYTTTYKGTAIALETDFDYYAEQGLLYIDQQIMGDIPENNDSIKKCICRLADLLYINKVNKNLEEVKSSEKIGEYSVSYAVKTLSVAEISNEVNNIIHLYLGKSGLLCKIL